MAGIQPFRTRKLFARAFEPAWGIAAMGGYAALVIEARVAAPVTRSLKSSTVITWAVENPRIVSVAL